MTQGQLAGPPAQAGEDKMSQLFDRIGRTGLLFFSLDAEKERKFDAWIREQSCGGNGKCGGFVDSERMSVDEIMQFLSEGGLHAMLLVRNNELSDLELVGCPKPGDFEEVTKTTEKGHTYQLAFLSHHSLVLLQNLLDTFFVGRRKGVSKHSGGIHEIIVPIKKGDRIFSILVSLDQVIR